MQPRKNPKYDLESQRAFRFLIGLSISLLAVVLVFEIRTPVKEPMNPPQEEPTQTAGLSIPITVPAKPEIPKSSAKPKKFDEKLPPEVLPDDEVEKLLYDDHKMPEEELEDVEDGALESLDGIETLPPVAIQHVARPVECADVYDGEEQKRCLNAFMQSFVKQHAKVPQQAREMGLDGAVIVNFVIDEHGKVTDVQVTRGEYEILNTEARELIEKLPDFIPASQFGKKVRMQMNLRVNFRY